VRFPDRAAAAKPRLRAEGFTGPRGRAARQASSPVEPKRTSDDPARAAVASGPIASRPTTSRTTASRPTTSRTTASRTTTSRTTASRTTASRTTASRTTASRTTASRMTGIPLRRRATLCQARRGPSPSLDRETPRSRSTPERSGGSILLVGCAPCEMIPRSATTRSRVSVLAGGLVFIAARHAVGASGLRHVASERG